MKKQTSDKQWPVYRQWSDSSDHLNGIPLNDAFEKFLGENDSVEIFRRQIELELPKLSEIEQRQLLKMYRDKVRQKQTSFAERAATGHYYTTGIRFPYAEVRMREEIPFEYWTEFNINHEKNTVEAKSKDFDNQRITYVEVLVSTGFWHNEEYDRVAIKNFQFRLNKTQARIVRLLHRALKAGNEEGLFSKQLLADVGKRSGDIGDYFKDQELWRLLIARTSPGRYRLNANRL